MCNKNSPTNSNSNSMKTISIRRTRSKTRKPKFLSLRLEISPESTDQNSGDMNGVVSPTHHHQLDLFPLHPENMVEEKDANYENVDYFFSGAGATTTLTGLLSAGECSDDDKAASFGDAYMMRGEKESDLVRTALRSKERDASEEKWVCYSEVVEEVTSCAADLQYKGEAPKQQQGLLSLKLDYEEIMNAWSDKGPLYIQMESPQTVPDLHDDTMNGKMGGWGCSSSSGGGLWTVPENSYSYTNNNNNNNNININVVKTEDKVVVGGGDHDLKMGQREASVLRYKEKRQNRLFSKRIRYQVRKLNAEKRPRMKGRFVKRT